MKNLIYLLRDMLTVSILLLCASCERDKTIPIVNCVITDNVIAYTNSVSISGSIGCDAPVNYLQVQLSKDKNFEIVIETKEVSVESSNCFSCVFTNLSDGTLYFIKYVAKNSINSFNVPYSNKFTTIKTDVPILICDSVFNVTMDSARVKARILSRGNLDLSVVGLCWSVSENPTIENEHIELSTMDSTLSYSIKSLKTNTQYYVKAYASNTKGIGYSNQLSFCTFGSTLPIIQTINATNITANIVTVGGAIDNQGSSNIVSKGIRWSESLQFVYSDQVKKSESDDLKYSIELTELKPDTKYYYCAFAENKYGTTYGDVKTFSTIHTDLPSVISESITNIRATSAFCSGKLTSPGSSSVTEQGFCYSTHSNPTIDDQRVVASSSSNIFTSSISNLSSDKLYYLRAYAVNSYGVGYGSQLSFTTETGLVVTTTNEVKNITAISADFSGKYEQSPYYAVIEKGFCLSNTNYNPTIYDNKLVATGTSNIFSLKDVNLSANTTYYLRAFTKTQYGVSYGNSVNFVTKTGLADVETGKIDSVSNTEAVCQAKVFADSYAPIIERGVCWNISSNPTVDGQHLSSGTGNGDFTIKITKLSPSQKYYVRAYAKNKYGTTYGDTKSFTTASGYATVITKDVNEVTAETALLKGNVTIDQYIPIKEMGFCYSQKSNPTITDTKIESTLSSGDFQNTIDGLTPSQTYYVRAYAITASGVSYGSIITFTTKSGLALMKTTQVSNVHAESAFFSSNVLSESFAPVQEKGFCWGKTSVPTISSNYVICGQGSGDFSKSVALEPNTNYYVRAYSKTKYGIAYGDEVSFRTTTGLPLVSDVVITYIKKGVTKCESEVLSEGEDAVLKKGVCWSLSPNPTINDNISDDGFGIGKFSSIIEDMDADITYYIRSYAINKYGVIYSVNEISAKYVSGAIMSEFSVSPSEKVYFSQGNLMYERTSEYWYFENHQYDWHTDMNIYLELFAWGTSGHFDASDRAVQSCSGLNYRPTSSHCDKGHVRTCAIGGLTDDFYKDFNTYACGPSTTSTYKSLIGGSVMYDWGYNQIINGGNISGYWRLLTIAEVEYLFEKRENSDNLYGLATIIGHTGIEIHGLIILPDKWILPSGLSFIPKPSNPAINSYTLSEWERMEENGAVFLPSSGIVECTGSSSGERKDKNICGYYWTSTYRDQSSAKILKFGNNNNYSIGAMNRGYGNAVRLVHDVK